MSQDQAPREHDPADPVSASPDEVATADGGSAKIDQDPLAASDPNAKSDTTKGASIEPTD